MIIKKLDHYNFDTDKPVETLQFYTEVLGLTEAADLRPASSGPGTWVLIGDHPAIHINFKSEPVSTETGTFRHIAFEASNYPEFEKRFRQHDIPYRISIRPEINLVQLFVDDPNGICLEFNIPGECA